MIINRTSRKDITDLIDGLLNDYEAEIDKAYRKAEGKLSLSLSVKLKGYVAEVSLSFSMGKIKDGGKVILGQGELPEKPLRKVYTIKDTEKAAECS